MGGALFIGLISIVVSKMIIREKLPDLVNEKTAKYIKDLEFDNCFLEKKLNIVMRDNVRIIKERNEFASDISKKLKGL